MHWYDKDGNAHHTYINDKGEEKNTTITQARKNNWYPSVTTILGCWKSSFLEDWGANQRLFRFCNWCVDQVADHVRSPEEIIEFMRWIGDEEDKSDGRKKWLSSFKELGNAYLNSTADFGTAIHNELENFHNDITYQIKEEYLPYCQPYLDWFEQNVESVFHAELQIASATLMTAGSVDCILVLKNDPRFHVLDFKSRKLSGTKSSDFRLKDFAQMACYSEMVREKYDLDYSPPTISFGIATNNIGFGYPMFWSEEEQARGFRYFKAMAEAWREDNKYYG